MAKMEEEVKLLEQQKLSLTTEMSQVEDLPSNIIESAAKLRNEQARTDCLKLE